MKGSLLGERGEHCSVSQPRSRGACPGVSRETRLKPDFRELFIPVCPAVCVTHRHPDSSLGGQNPISNTAEHQPRALNETSRFPEVLEDTELA